MPIKVDIKVENGVLVAQATGQSAFPLSPNGKDKFSFEAAGLDLEFNTAKGELTIIQGGTPIVFTRDGGPVVVAAPAVAPAAPAKGKKK
jgi:D-alanyl-D-alanine carboxypeptidase